jgi:AraC-like DNA-binding protein
MFFLITKLSLIKSKKLIIHDKIPILSLHLKRFLEYSGLQGIPEKDLLAVIKHSPIDFIDPVSTIEASDFYAVLQAISEVVKDDQLGIKIGEYFNLNTLGIIYRVSMKAATLEEALSYCKEYAERTFPVIQVIHSFDGANAIIELLSDNGPYKLKRIILECTLVIINREIRLITGEKIKLRIGSPYYEADYPFGWEKADSFNIKFESEVLRSPIPERNRWQLEILIPEYLNMIENMKSGEAFSDKVKAMALNMSKPTMPDLKSISYAFNLTPRTFQRRLIAEETHYSQVINELKQQICILLIQHQRFSIANISSILGYSEPAAFIRSFKNKYGSSPLKYRRALNHQN